MLTKYINAKIIIQCFILIFLIRYYVTVIPTILREFIVFHGCFVVFPLTVSFILYKNVAILKMYKGYYDEQEANKKIIHYNILWRCRKIYK